MVLRKNRKTVNILCYKIGQFRARAKNYTVSLCEALLMSNHNIRFCGKIEKKTVNISITKLANSELWLRTIQKASARRF